MIGRFLAVALFLAANVAAQESWLQPVRVTGEIHDEEGVPVANAEIALRMVAGPFAIERWRRAALAEPLATAKSDAEGRFAIDLPEWTTLIDVRLALITSAPGHRAHVAAVHPFLRRTHRHEIVLGEPNDHRELVHWVSGTRFIDSGGQALAGARVAVLSPVPAPRCIPTYGRERGFVPVLIGKTDARGRLDLCVVPVSAWPAFAIVERDAHEVPVQIEDGDGDRATVVPEIFEISKATRDLVEAAWTNHLAREAVGREAAVRSRAAMEGEIAGRVVDAGGMPLVGAEVVVLRADQALDQLASVRMRDYRPRRPFARTDTSGGFRVSHLTLGRYRVQAAAPGHIPALSREVVLETWPWALIEVPTIVLAPGGRLRITDAEEHVQIRVGADSVRLWMNHGRTIDGLPAAEITVTNTLGGCAEWGGGRVNIRLADEATIDMGVR